MDVAGREAAESLLADAKALLEGLSPGRSVETTMPSGDPNRELMRASGEAGAETIFVGRGRRGFGP